MRYTVDEALCAGHGHCLAAAPHVFQEGEDCLPTALGKVLETDDAHLDAVRAAARVCPEQAIRVVDHVRA